MIEAIENQTLMDVSLTTYGSVEASVLLSALNAVKLHEPLKQGQLIEEAMLDEPLIREQVANELQQNGMLPATAFNYDVKAYIELINQTMTTQKLDKTITGPYTAPSIKVDNLYRMITIQLTYAMSKAVHVFIEQSLDGVNFDPIPGADKVLDVSEQSHTFNLIDLHTNYVRVRVDASETSGVIQKIEYQV